MEWFSLRPKLSIMSQSGSRYRHTPAACSMPGSSRTMRESSPQRIGPSPVWAPSPVLGRHQSIPLRVAGSCSVTRGAFRFVEAASAVFARRPDFAFPARCGADRNETAPGCSCPSSEREARCRLKAITSCSIASCSVNAVICSKGSASLDRVLFSPR